MPTPSERFAAFKTKKQAETPSERFVAFKSGRPEIQPAIVTDEVPIEAPPLTMGETLSQAVGNIPQSGLEYGKNILQALTSPVQTAKGIGSLVGGAGAALSDTILDTLGIPEVPEEAQDPKLRGKKQLFDATVKGLSERYGGINELKRTIATDPVGFLADLSAATTAGGALVGKLGKSAKVAKLQQLGKDVSKVGQAVEPLSLPKTIVKGTSKAISKLTPENTLNKMVESSFKFSAKIPVKERSKLAQAALNEGIVPSAKGVEKINGIIDDINTQIASAIEKGGKKGVSIPSKNVLTRLDDLKAFYSESVMGDIAIKEIDDIAKNFKAQFGAKIPLARAQKIKQNTNAILRKQFGEMKSVAVETQKNIARGLKEEIASRFPEIQRLNERESSLIALNKELEKAVRRIDNRNIISLGAKVTGAGGAAAGGAPGGLIGLLADQILGNPNIKTRLAIAIKKGKKLKVVEPSKLRLLRQLSTQAGRVDQPEEEPEKPIFKPRLANSLKPKGTVF